MAHSGGGGRGALRRKLPKILSVVLSKIITYPKTLTMLRPRIITASRGIAVPRPRMVTDSRGIAVSISRVVTDTRGIAVSISRVVTDTRGIAVSILRISYWSLFNLIDKDMSGDEDGNQTVEKYLTMVEDLMFDLMWGPSDDD